MLDYGAEQVLIDGAIDRRAASSPAVADGLVISTGAVLSEDIEEVVRITVEAIELVRLPVLSDSGVRTLLEEQPHTTALLGDDLAPQELPPRFILTSESEQTAQLLDSSATARWLIVAGALPERFLSQLAHATHRRRRELTVVVADPTKVFLSTHGLGWYRAQGIDLQALNTIALRAITVNPLAPESHSFDSTELRARLREAIPDVPIFDVLHEDYPGARPTALSATRVS